MTDLVSRSRGGGKVIDTGASLCYNDPVSIAAHSAHRAVRASEACPPVFPGNECASSPGR
jgi:hypothetical protein